MWILVKSTDQTGLTVVPAVYCLVPGREYSVGRVASDLIVESQAASSTHATIYVREKDNLINGSEVWIHDKSRYGTYVNSQKEHNSEFQIFNGDKIVFGKWSCLSYAYTYVLRWDPITLCYSRCVQSLPSIRDRVHKYNVAAVDSWDDSATHVVVNELRTTFKVLCGLSKGIPIVRQSWVDQLIRSIEDFTPLPQPSEHMPDTHEDCDISDIRLFHVNLKRKSLFEGKTFYFLNTQEYELLHVPISYCGGSSTLVNISDATFDTYAAVDSVVVSRKIDKFCAQEGGAEFISQLQLALLAEGRTNFTDYEIIHAILKVSTDFTHSSPITQSQIPEQYTTPPDVEEDESFPHKKKTKIDVDFFSSDDQSVSENVNELIAVNKNSSPPQNRKHLIELKLNSTSSVALDSDSCLPQLSPALVSKSRPLKVLRKCFVKFQHVRDVTYISPLVPYVSGGVPLFSEEEEDNKSSVKVKVENTPKRSKLSGHFRSPPRTLTIVVEDSSDEEDNFLNVTPLKPF